MVAIKNISLQSWAITRLLNFRISHNNVDKTVNHIQLQTKPKTKKPRKNGDFYTHKIVETRMVAIKHISLQDGDIARFFNVRHLTRMLTVFMLIIFHHRIDQSQDYLVISQECWQDCNHKNDRMTRI